MLTMTCLFVVVTGIQFWITDYLIQVLGVEQSDAYQLYFMVGAIGPVLGIIMCAMIFDRIGGYTSEHALSLCCAFGFLGMVAALASVMVRESAMLCGVLITIELFGGAFVMPACTGLMLN